MADTRTRATNSATGQSDPGGTDRLAVILDQTAETLELVRSLVALLLQQRQGDDGRPKLEDLLAALVAQLRDILASVQQIRADLGTLHDRVDRAIGRAGHGHGRGNGAARP